MSVRNAQSEYVDQGLVSVPDVVDTPTIGTATDVGTSRAYNNGAATVTFTPATTGGAASTYTATSTPGSFTGSGTSSPVTVAGLSSATAYTFTVQGVNSSGTWAASSASNSITATTIPQAPTIGTFTDGGTGTSGTLSFTAGATGGKTITAYKYSTDGSTYTTASGTTSPLSITGLTPATYTFTLKAANDNGDSLASSGVSGTVIQPTAFDSIATATGTGSSTTITFSSIPSTYQHLQIRFFGRTTTGVSALSMTFNGSAGTNYARHYLAGDGATAFVSGAADTAQIWTGYAINSTNMGGVGIIDIHDYASTTKNKTVRAFTGNDTNTPGNDDVRLSSGVWKSTSAITSITFTSTDNFATNATFALYGIKGA
jgi:hypothetical protein